MTELGFNESALNTARPTESPSTPHKHFDHTVRREQHSFSFEVRDV
jgi:hypothetical protein